MRVSSGRSRCGPPRQHPEPAASGRLRGARRDRLSCESTQSSARSPGRCRSGCAPRGRGAPRATASPGTTRTGRFNMYREAVMGNWGGGLGREGLDGVANPGRQYRQCALRGGRAAGAPSGGAVRARAGQRRGGPVAGRACSAPPAPLSRGEGHAAAPFRPPASPPVRNSRRRARLPVHESALRRRGCGRAADQVRPNLPRRPGGPARDGGSRGIRRSACARSGLVLADVRNGKVTPGRGREGIRGAGGRSTVADRRGSNRAVAPRPESKRRGGGDGGLIRTITTAFPALRR